MKFVAFLGSLFIRGLHATLRVRHVRAENIERLPQYILAFWHCHLLLMLHSRYRRPISVIISQSKDGEAIARVFDWYGVDSARGSSTRGGSAALARADPGSAQGEEHRIHARRSEGTGARGKERSGLRGSGHRAADPPDRLRR